jgi:nucleotide-binding universal stress UspA family protein
MTSPTFVVPLDGSAYSERALPIATALAQRAGGGLLLVSVRDHGTLRPAEYLEEVAAAYPRPVPVTTATNSDTYPAEAIVQIAHDTEDSIVCMTSHGRGGLRWGLLGSVAEEVMRRADRPTFLVGRHCREDFLTDSRYLLTGVDGTETSSQLAPVVNDWAKRLGLELRVAIVVHPLDIESAERPDAVLDPIIEQFGGPDRATATMLTSRYPEGSLADYAGDIGAAVIAMNGHCRTGLTRFALGSTTLGLVHQAPCPVLVAPRRTKEASTS